MDPILANHSRTKRAKCKSCGTTDLPRKRRKISRPTLAECENNQSTLESATIAAVSNTVYPICKTCSDDSLSAETTKGERRGAFPFFELPPELRNRVYKLCLVPHCRPDCLTINRDHTHPETLRYSLHCQCCSGMSRIYRPATQILRLNRQSNYEAGSLLFKNIKIKFGCASDLLSFLMLSGRHRAFLHQIEINEPFSRTDDDTLHQAFRLLIDATELQRISFRWMRDTDKDDEDKRHPLDNIFTEHTDTTSPESAVRIYAESFSHFLRPWLRAIAARTGQKSAGLKLIELEDASYAFMVLRSPDQVSFPTSDVYQKSFATLEQAHQTYGADQVQLAVHYAQRKFREELLGLAFGFPDWHITLIFSCSGQTWATSLQKQLISKSANHFLSSIRF